jgi:predicted nucleic acid-binding protein
VTRRTLLDTGPLVAFLDRRDRYHGWATTHLGELIAPLSEACLRQMHGGGAAVLELVRRGLLQIDFRLEENAGPVAKLLVRYADVPMSLADACLVRMAELQPASGLLTLDRDFRMYRRHGRQVIATTMPDGP